MPRWGKLDIFVGNAGILGPLSPLHHVTEDAWNQVIDINLSANWRLIRTLDPLLKRSEAGRAVFVTSGASSGKYAYWGPYAVSKAGLEALVKTYAHELQDTPVRVNLVNPGPMRTAMRAKAFPGEDPNTLPDPSELVPMFLELVSPDCTLSGRVVNFPDWKKKHAPPTRDPGDASSALHCRHPGAGRDDGRACCHMRRTTGIQGSIEVDDHVVVGGLDPAGSSRRSAS